MDLDTPATESNASLSVRDAATLFGAEPEQEAEQSATATDETQASSEATETETDDQTAPEKVTPEVEMVEVDIDGFKVQVPKDKAEALEKDRLRQADYTRKTMATAEERKAAEGEASKAREERQRYAQGLQQANAVLNAQLQEQSKIDWHQLRETDPNEFLRQWHLFSERQANLQKVLGEQQHLSAQAEAEQAEQIRSFVQSQQEQLLAKVPEWKDEAKAKAGQAELVAWLKTNEFPNELLQIVDRSSHLIVGLRKAALYDQMMAKASAAAKKVEKLPAKVERPGVTDPNPLDGRTAAMKRLGQSGSIRDAAGVLSHLF